LKTSLTVLRKISKKGADLYFQTSLLTKKTFHARRRPGRRQEGGEYWAQKKRKAEEGKRNRSYPGILSEIDVNLRDTYREKEKK